MKNPNIFDPVTLSLEENAFLLEHLDEPVVVAMPKVGAGIAPSAVRKVLERVQELNALQKHQGEAWVGTDAMRAAIKTYLYFANKWANDKRKGRPRFPSMHSYDAKGRPHRGGVGADAGTVKTYFNEKGERVPFQIELVPDNIPQWHPEWAKADHPTPGSGIVINDELSRIECFCGHTVQFKPESRSSYTAARGRMSRHLKTATVEVDKHREIRELEFGG